MRDPEMCFLVVDKRVNEKDHLLVAVYPQMYQLDSIGLYEESILIENGRVTSCLKTWQSGHCSFANIWLKNISRQGFLSNPIKKRGS